MKLHAYVTGADRGLGLGLVKVLLESGYKVFAGSYLPEWNELQDVQTQYPNDLIVLPLNVTDDDSVTQAALTISSQTESLNLLINNAGSAQDRSGTILDRQYYDDIRKLYETNTLGTLRITHSVIRLLLDADKKTIVNISSVAGSVGSVTRNHQYGYTMSKAAINMQSKLLHNHFKDEGLRVLVIHPGWMRSHIFGDIERMKNAPLEPIESARSIVRLIETKQIENDEIYMDYTGAPLPW